MAMVARNYQEVDPDLFYPRIDIAGEKSGITGMEFPLLNYLMYLVGLVFGQNAWHGRLVNIIVSSFGVFYFFKCLSLFFNRNRALLCIICFTLIIVVFV